MSSGYIIATEDSSEAETWKPETFDKLWETAGTHQTALTETPIKKWTSLEVAKPTWEERDHLETSVENEVDDKPYGQWKSTLNLHSVPFSRSLDSKKRNRRPKGRSKSKRRRLDKKVKI